MKNLYLLFTFALMSIFASGQTPQAFKYQAVARDLNGNPVINQEISVRISIIGHRSNVINKKWFRAQFL